MVNQRKLFITTFILILTLLILGGWWMYVIFHLNNHFASMVKWEGSFFLFLIFAITFALLRLYLRDYKKTYGLQMFYASLSHELKTPLSDIRLQSEVINDTQESELSRRLIDATRRLEIEFDKILQLSRIELDGELNLHSIDLLRFLHKFQKKVIDQVTFNIIENSEDSSWNIYADEVALKHIFNNLYENTLRHAKTSKADITLSRKTNSQYLTLTYNDHPGKFLGAEKNLGHLFYKFNSKKGHGIGLYLVKRLMKKMGGNLLIDNKHELQFHLIFPLQRECS